MYSKVETRGANLSSVGLVVEPKDYADIIGFTERPEQGHDMVEPVLDRLAVLCFPFDFGDVGWSGRFDV